ncbi:MAG: futalosine hydrolase [Phycisphaerales bacterium]|jgi:futalosine hydrolase|nr:futalosine hydrolase [Phycisphaerales bacterium]
MPTGTESDLPGPLLVLAAAPLEGAAILRAASIPGAGPGTGPGDADLSKSWYRIALREGEHAVDLALTRVGKAMAAACAARLLTQSPCAGVVNLGICGVLPRAVSESQGHSEQWVMPIDLVGRPVFASHSVMGDEGLLEPAHAAPRFTTIDAMGFPAVPPAPGMTPETPPDPRRPASPALASALLSRLTRAGLDPLRGTIATISTCSGTDAGAREVVRRTGAIAEAMEGAAIAQVCAMLSVPFVELRVISNTTGDRAAQHWDMPRAKETLERVARAILA